jgi:hypothetical protein
MFVSPSSLGSDWCRQEVKYAIGLKKKILPIYIEDVELTRGLQMRMGNRQAIFWYEYDTEEELYWRLFKARRLDSCLTDEARRRRGVKPKRAATKKSPQMAESEKVVPEDHGTSTWPKHPRHLAETPQGPTRHLAETPQGPNRKIAGRCPCHTCVIA